MVRAQRLGENLVMLLFLLFIVILRGVVVLWLGHTLRVDFVEREWILTRWLRVVHQVYVYRFTNAVKLKLLYLS